VVKILYLASSWPRGGTFGGQLRALHIGRALQQVGQVTLSVVNSDPPEPQNLRESAAEFSLAPPVVAQPTGRGGVLGRLRRAADPRYLDVHGCAALPVERQRIAALISAHDLVWIMNSRTPNLLQRWNWPKSHLDIDDVPSTYLRARAEAATTPLQRWKARVQQALLRRRERLYPQRFTTLSVCSEEDRAYLGNWDMIHVIPNGFTLPSTTPVSQPVSPPRIGFIGLFSYPPNLEGVRWFLDQCWPALRQAVPGVRLRLVGKETDGPLRPRDPDVDALGFVSDPAAEIATWSAMAIPIRVGGGTRIKIAEAFSRKCPVVSTRLGAYGYAVEDRRHLRLADSSGDFVQACVDLIRDRKAAAAMAEFAWSEYLNRWTWDAIAPRVTAAAEDCLRRSAATPAPTPAPAA
jgi:glycosyltransferase involved in cell wall biosynthesis